MGLSHFYLIKQARDLTSHDSSSRNRGQGGFNLNGKRLVIQRNLIATLLGKTQIRKKIILFQIKQKAAFPYIHIHTYIHTYMQPRTVAIMLILLQKFARGWR